MSAVDLYGFLDIWRLFPTYIHDVSDRAYPDRMYDPISIYHHVCTLYMSQPLWVVDWSQRGGIVGGVLYLFIYSYKHWFGGDNKLDKTQNPQRDIPFFLEIFET